MTLFLQQEDGLSPGTTAGIATFASLFGVGFSAGVLIDRIGRRGTMIIVLVAVSELMFPIMYVMKTSGGNIDFTAVGQMLLAGLAGAAAVPAYAAFTGLFPASVRYTGAAMGVGLGSAIGGSFDPYLAGKLTEVTGNSYAPAGLVAGAAVIDIAVISTMPSRAVVEDQAIVQARQHDRDVPENSDATSSNSNSIDQVGLDNFSPPHFRRG